MACVYTHRCGHACAHVHICVHSREDLKVLEERHSSLHHPQATVFLTVPGFRFQQMKTHVIEIKFNNIEMMSR